MALTRDGLLKPKVVERDIKALGDSIYLRLLTAGEVIGMDDSENVGKILALSICDADGNRLFGDDEHDDALRLSMQAVNEIMENINDVNGLEREDEEGN